MNRDRNQNKRMPASTRRVRQQQQGTVRPLPAVSTPRALVPVTPSVTTGQRVKYAATSILTTGLGAGLLGAHSLSPLIALGAGILTWHFADTIRVRWFQHGGPDDACARPAWLTWKWWTSPFPASRSGQQQHGDPEAEALMHDPDIQRQAEELARSFEAAIPEDELLKLGRIVKTRQRLDPPLDNVLGKGLIIMGSQGTGKSNIVGLLMQCAGRIGKIGMPSLVIDYKGEFSTLLDILPNSVIAGHISFAQETGRRFFALTTMNAGELAQIIMEGPAQVILDTTTWNGNNDEVAQVIAALLHALMDWSRAMRRAGKEPWPCLVVTDEAHNFLPQKQSLSALAMERPKESFGALTSAYSRMANTGRSYGYTLVMATQRLPNIAKWAIANLQIKIVLAHAEKNDLDACEEETGGQVDREVIKGLSQGTGIVIGFTKEPVIVRFDRQKAQHVSNTPKIKDVRAQFENAPRPRLSRVLAAHTPLPEQTAYQQPSETLPSSPTPLRPAQERDEMPSDGRHARNVTVVDALDVSSNHGGQGERNARNVEACPAPQQGVTPSGTSVSGVTLLPGWDQEKFHLLPGAYIALGNIDKSLEALKISTSQRNRDFARERLKQLGLWKEKK